MKVSVLEPEIDKNGKNGQKTNHKVDRGTELVIKRNRPNNIHFSVTVLAFTFRRASLCMQTFI